MALPVVNTDWTSLRQFFVLKKTSSSLHRRAVVSDTSRLAVKHSGPVSWALGPHRLPVFWAPILVLVCFSSVDRGHHGQPDPSAWSDTRNAKSCSFDDDLTHFSSHNCLAYPKVESFHFAIFAASNTSTLKEEMISITMVCSHTKQDGFSTTIHSSAVLMWGFCILSFFCFLLLLLLSLIF